MAYIASSASTGTTRTLKRYIYDALLRLETTGNHSPGDAHRSETTLSALGPGVAQPPLIVRLRIGSVSVVCRNSLLPNHT